MLCGEPLTQYETDSRRISNQVTTAKHLKKPFKTRAKRRVRAPWYDAESWELELYGEHLRLYWNGGIHFSLQHLVDNQWHTRHAFTKFGCQSSSEACAYALKYLDDINTNPLVTPRGKLSPIWKFNYENDYGVL